MRLVILTPVLGRPHRVQPLLESIAAATPERHRVLFIADPDDRETVAAVQASGAGLLIHGGTYPEKINAGVRATWEPLLFLGADDLHYHPGWLAAAEAHLSASVGVVGVNDLGTRRVREGRHATHFLVSRFYASARGSIDRPGHILHEGYGHQWTDDEFVATARARGAIAFATDSVVEHLHPRRGKAEDDDTYRKGRRTALADRRLFQSREHLWA